MFYRFTHIQRADFIITMPCRVCLVVRSAYNAWVAKISSVTSRSALVARHRKLHNRQKLFLHPPELVEHLRPSLITKTCLQTQSRCHLVVLVSTANASRRVQSLVLGMRFHLGSQALESA